MQKVKNLLGKRIAIVIFFVFTVCLYGPFSIFFPNAEELWFSLSMVTGIVLPVSLATFVILLLLSLIVPDDKLHLFTKLFFGLSLAMYIQGNYINISYGGGVQDGTEIIWSNYTWYAIVDTLAWILCFSVPFIVDIVVKGDSKKFHKAIVATSILLTVIQIPAFLSQALTFRPNQNAEVNITTKNMFEISDRENVLIFMVDTLDEQYYETFIEANPEYKEKLNGFVHYENAVAAGGRTIVGFPAMFTGTPFTRQNTYSDYLSAVWSAPNAFSLMNEAGYEVNVYSEPVLFSIETIDYLANFEYGGGKLGSAAILAKKLYKMDMYKFAPHLLKPAFWYTTSELDEAKEINNSYVSDDPDFYARFDSTGFTVNPDKAKVFQLYHLEGAHSPFKMDEKGNRSKSTLEKQVVGTFYRISQMLDDLRAKGLYDDATILIIADHGDKGNTGHFAFLLKEAGATGEYRSSTAPLSGFDLAPYLASLAGKELTGLPYSEDLTQLQEDSIRERHMFYNTSGNSRLQVREYVYKGAARDGGKVITTFDDSWAANIPVELGRVLSFAEDATANSYTVEGFGNNTGFRTKLFGPYVKMEMPLAQIPKDGGLKAHFTVYNKMPASVKKIIVTANGVRVFEGEITKELLAAGLDFTLPMETFKDSNMLILEFAFPELDESEMELSVKKRTETLSFVSFVIEKQ